MDRQNFPWGRVAAAGVLVLLLVLAGVVWLGFATERLRTDVLAVERAVREMPPPLPARDSSGLEAEVKALREAMAKLSSRVEALRAAEDTKALERLTAEIRALSGRVEGLSAKAAPAAAGKAGKSGAAGKKEKTPAVRETPGDDTPPRPYYGPGYPGWPGY
jgi:TolA-binding protein